MHYIIDIGSNEDRAVQMEAARGRLRAAFPGIRFSTEEETSPIGMRRRAPFANQVAAFTSPLSPGEVERELKRIEREAGRKPEEKALEIVRIDLDLLSADGRVLRPSDWARDYVVRGVNELEAQKQEVRSKKLRRIP